MMRLLTNSPIFRKLAHATWILTGHRYVLVRTLNRSGRPRLLLQGCQCDGTPHPLHRGRRTVR